MHVSTKSIAAATQQQPGKQILHWSGFRELLPAIFGIIWLVIAFFPILFMLITSLRPLADFFTDVPWLPPTHPTTADSIAAPQWIFKMHLRAVTMSAGRLAANG